jgi:RAT1-interacting protein
MCVGDTLYFEEHLSDEKIREKYVSSPFRVLLFSARVSRENMQHHHHLQTYYGYAFESYCTSSLPHCQPDQSQSEVRGWGGDVDTHAQWCSVVKTKLGNTRMVIGGEVDCVRGGCDLPPS